MRILAAASLVLILAASAYAEEAAKTVERAVPGEDGVQRVAVVGGGYFFKPHRIVVKVNVPVALTVRKEPGMVPHDIVMESPEAGISFSESLSSDPKTITFTPKKTGMFPFYCSKKLLFFEGHREKGMEGVLEVTE